MTEKHMGLAVVTGAGTGIGRAIACRLARSGYTCLLIGRTPSTLEETANLISAEGGQARVVAADVTAPDGRVGVMAAVDQEQQRLTALVNNAGGSSSSAPLFDQDLEKWRYDFALNLEAAAFLSFEAMRRMGGTGGGGIVNVASVYGLVSPNPAHYGDRLPPVTPNGPVRGVAYSASKGALRQLSRELAVAGAQLGVRVNTVSPGMIEVVSHGRDPAEWKVLAEATPMGRVGQPDEVAGAVSFLLSSESSFTTGAELVIDGGWTLW